MGNPHHARPADEPKHDHRWGIVRNLGTEINLEVTRLSGGLESHD